MILLGLIPTCNTQIITHNQASETSRFGLELILYLYSFKESRLNRFDAKLRDLYQLYSLRLCDLEDRFKILDTQLPNLIKNTSKLSF